MRRFPMFPVAMTFVAALALPLLGACTPGENAADDAPFVPEALASAFRPVDGDDPALEDFFVSVHDIAAALDGGADIVFVDARPVLDYEMGHIDGAISVPYFEVEQHLDEVPQDRWIVTYCECPHHEAGQAAQAFVDNGYRYVKVMEEGLGGWRDELGRPLVQSMSEG